MTSTTPRSLTLRLTLAVAALSALALGCDAEHPNDAEHPDEAERPAALELPAELELLRLDPDARADRPERAHEVAALELGTLDPTTVQLCLSEDGESWCWTPEDEDALELALIDLIPAQLDLRVCVLDRELYCCWTPEASGPGLAQVPPLEEGECIDTSPSGLPGGFYLTPSAPTNGGSSKPQKPIIDDYAPREDPSTSEEPSEPSDEGVDFGG